MSEKNEKSQQETATIKKETSISNKPPSYGTRLVQDREGNKANTVPRGNTKK
jgi:hypothetical protein